MSNETLLIYPTVDLFVYDLVQTVGQEKVEADKKRQQLQQQFWQKIYGKDIAATQLEKLKEDELRLEKLQQAKIGLSHYVELLGDRQVAPLNSQFDGYSYPVKLNDVYAAQFDLSGDIELDEEKKFAPKEINCLNTYKKEIISRIDPPAKIGQSWFVWGQLTTEDQDALLTAKNCYTALKLFPVDYWNRDLKATGTFAGANFYELWLPPGDTNKIDVTHNYHLLICLFPYNGGRSVKDYGITISKLYPHLLQLFAYRNKVIWGYSQSRQIKKITLQGYTEDSKEFIRELPKHLDPSREKKISYKKLKEYLSALVDISSNFTTCLSTLKETKIIIQNNLANHEKKLVKINEQLEQSSNKGFQFFMQNFNIFGIQKYLWQVDYDIEKISEELDYMKNAINEIKKDIEARKNEPFSISKFFQQILHF